MSDKPGKWTTTATEQFTVPMAKYDAFEAFVRAGEEANGWRVHSSQPDRVVVKNKPGFIDQRPYSVEVLLAEVDGATAVTLTGWTFGKGMGMKKMVGGAVGKFRSEFETHVR